MLSIYIMTQRTTTPLEITTPALVGLLVAASGGARLPARSWALDIAIEVIEASTATPSSLGRACSRVARSRAPSGGRLRALDKTVLGLARGGHLIPEGRGWDAGFSPAPAWLARHSDLIVELVPGDRAALRKAGQRLKAVLRTWSKKAVASDPVGSATS